MNQLPAACGYDEVDYQLFQQKVMARTGIRLCDYKADQMRRRVASMAAAAGCTSFDEYFAAMERDAALLTGFLDRMTINVTELLRNPDLFAHLGELILPGLLQSRGALPLSVWSAGCSYGAEAYSVAMLLEELTPGINHRIRGSDVDLTVLARAMSASFTPADMLNVSRERRARYFVDPATGCFLPSMTLRRRTDFFRHDLLSDTYPAGAYDLILCRNVLIYFTDDAKERIYRGFHRALRPGGILFVGGTERLSDHKAVGFETIRPFFYAKKEIAAAPALRAA